MINKGKDVLSERKNESQTHRSATDQTVQQDKKDNMTVNMTLVSHSITNSKKTAQFQNAVPSGSNTLYNDD